MQEYSPDIAGGTLRTPALPVPDLRSVCQQPIRARPDGSRVNLQPGRARGRSRREISCDIQTKEGGLRGARPGDDPGETGSREGLNRIRGPFLCRSLWAAAT